MEGVENVLTDGAAGIGGEESRSPLRILAGMAMNAQKARAAGDQRHPATATGPDTSLTNRVYDASLLHALNASAQHSASDFSPAKTGAADPLVDLVHGLFKITNHAKAVKVAATLKDRLQEHFYDVQCQLGTDDPTTERQHVCVVVLARHPSRVSITTDNATNAPVLICSNGHAHAGSAKQESGGAWGQEHLLYYTASVHRIVAPLSETDPNINNIQSTLFQRLQHKRLSCKSCVIAPSDDQDSADRFLARNSRGAPAASA